MESLPSLRRIFLSNIKMLNTEIVQRENTAATSLIYMPDRAFQAAIQARASATFVGSAPAGAAGDEASAAAAASASAAACASAAAAAACASAAAAAAAAAAFAVTASAAAASAARCSAALQGGRGREGGYQA